MQNLSLNIEVGFRTFTACILDKKSGKIKFIEHFETEKDEDITTNSECLNHDFEHVNIAFSDANFSLVPKAVFHDDNLQNVLALNLGDAEDVVEKVQTLEALQSICAYRLPKKRVSFFTQKFKQAAFTHGAITFYRLAEKLGKKNNQELCVFNYSDGFFIAHFNNGQLHLLNYFPYKNIEDFIYLLLFLCKELGIKQKDAEVLLLGNIKTAEQLKPYFKSVNCPEANEKLSLSFMVSLLHTCV